MGVNYYADMKIVIRINRLNVIFTHSVDNSEYCNITVKTQCKQNGTIKQLISINMYVF